ncbi:hypothetical protein LLG95_18250 [bacterium]|nr:hypothetical protein [bacterium]
MNNAKKRWTEFASILLVSLVLIALAYNNSRMRAGNSNASLRPTTEWDDAHGSPVPPVQINPGVLSSLRVTTSTNQMVMGFVEPGSPSPNAYDFQTHTMKPGETIKLDGEDLNLSSIWVAIQQTSAGLTRIEYDPARNAQKTISSNWGGGWNEFPTFPRLRLRFKQDKPVTERNMNVVAMKIFDVKSRQPISVGWVSVSEPGFLNVDSFACTLESAPVEIMLEFATGPAEKISVPAKDGAGLTTGSCVVRLIHHFPYACDASYDNRGRYSFTPSTSVANKQEDFFFLWPPNRPLGVQIAALDKDGNEIRPQYLGIHNQYFMPRRYDNTREIVSYTITRQPRRHRVFLQLPSIPGLPPENASVADPLDLRVPYVKFTSNMEMKDFIMKSLRLNRSEIGLPFNRAIPIGPADFPMELTNVRLRDIVERYARGGKYSIDYAQGIFAVTYPMPVSQRIRIFWRKLF